MTFTYDLASADETKALISEVRLELGDTQSNAGVKPDGTNFTDEEIQHWLDKADNDVNQTVAHACHALSRAWTMVANMTVGPRKEELGKIADGWATRAEETEAGTDVSTNSHYKIRVRKVKHVNDPYNSVPPEERKL